MTGVMCAMVGVGGSAPLDTQTVTVGTFTDGMTVFVRGYIQGLMGSISDGTFNPKGGATILVISYDALGAAVNFSIDGATTNDGWTTMAVGAAEFSRASASFSTPGGVRSDWIWTGVSTDPFGADSTNTLVVFR